MSFLTNVVTVARRCVCACAFEGLVAPFQIGAAILSARGDGLKAKAAAALQEPRVQRIALRSAARLPAESRPVPAVHRGLSEHRHRDRHALPGRRRGARPQRRFRGRVRAQDAGDHGRREFLSRHAGHAHSTRATSPTCAWRCGATTSPRSSSRWPAASPSNSSPSTRRPDRRAERSLPAGADRDRHRLFRHRRRARTDDLVAWATLMFWYLFIDLAGDPELGRKALDAAAACRSVIDAAIAQRKASGEAKDDVLGRCLVLQKAGQPGMDDLGIRNNLIGLLSARSRRSPRPACRRSTSCSTGRRRSRPPRRRRGRRRCVAGRACVRGVPLQSHQPADLPARRARCADRRRQPARAA